MPPQELAFGVPATEEMVETGAGLAGAGITGVVEGVIVKMSPQLGALEAPFTWATLLGFPLVGAAGALFTKGILGNLFQGVASGGIAIAAYVLPAMLVPDMFGKKGRSGGGAGAGDGIKQLSEGALGAARRAQEATAKSILDI